MNARERRGVVVLVLLFLVLGFVLAMVMRRDGGPATGTFENNPIVEQRLINLQKSR